MEKVTSDPHIIKASFQQSALSRHVVAHPNAAGLNTSQPSTYASLDYSSQLKYTAKDKGKSVLTSETQPHDASYLPLNAMDYPYLAHLPPSNLPMDPMLTNLQNVLDHPEQASCTDFLSLWAKPKPTIISPRPFRIHPPLDYSLTIPFLSAHPTPPTPRTHFTRKSINTTPKYSRFHRYYISSFIQPSSPPLPTNSSPFPPSPCPPLSLGLPSDYILKKRATIIDDDEVPLSPFKKPRSRRSQPIMLSIVPMGPMASFLTSLLVPF